MDVASHPYGSPGIGAANLPDRHRPRGDGPCMQEEEAQADEREGEAPRDGAAAGEHARLTTGAAKKATCYKYQ